MRFLLLLIIGFICNMVTHGANILDTLDMTGKIKPVEIMCNLRANRSSEVIKKHIINSKKEFEDLFDNDCSIEPNINFDTETLLIFHTHSSGCRTPKIIRTFKIYKNKAVYHIHTIETGLCKPLFHNINSVIVPKIKSDVEVIFEEKVERKMEE